MLYAAVATVYHHHHVKFMVIQAKKCWFNCEHIDKYSKVTHDRYQGISLGTIYVNVYFILIKFCTYLSNAVVPVLIMLQLIIYLSKNIYVPTILIKCKINVYFILMEFY